MIKNNAEVAAKIVAEMNEPASGNDSDNIKTPNAVNESKTVSANANDPVVIGGSIVDLSYSVQEDNLQVS